MTGELSGKAAIVGIGATDFSKDSGRSELRLAAEAVLDALDDAGLTPADVDGMVTFTMDSNTEVAIARATGIGDLTFFSKIHHGGGAACATIQQAAIAVATGVADCVVAYRAFNERSGVRFGQVQSRLFENADSTGVDNSFSYPHGLSTPAAQVAMIAKRYMHLSGATSRDFGAVSVADRKHAAKNPKAYFYEKPITIEDHQNSRWIAEPLRLLDCCQETDGAVALVVTSAERARDLKNRPAVIEAASQGSSPNQYSMVSYYRPELDGLPEMGLVGRQLWEQSKLNPTDIQTAILYDHFTPFTLIQLEELGFCGRGEAKDFIADEAIEIGGRLPINTHGGQLGEAYIHGMNGIAEGVRQLRGSSVNQVPDVEHVLVTAGTGVPTSGLILGLWGHQRGAPAPAGGRSLSAMGGLGGGPGVVLVTRLRYRSQARCTCGWVGKRCLLLSSAKVDALIHAAQTDCEPATPLVYPGSVVANQAFSTPAHPRVPTLGR